MMRIYSRSTTESNILKEQGFEASNGVLTRYTGNAAIVSIPEGIKEIAASAFMGCSFVTEINIPDSVISVDRYAFVSCASLKNVNIGFGIKSIPMGCFCELPLLENLVLTDEIELIDDFAFRNCKSLKNISFLTMKLRDPITAEEKGKAFELMLSGKPEKISYVDIADSAPAIKRIGNHAFLGCNQLDSTTIKEKVLDLGITAFEEKNVDEIPVVSEPESSIYAAEEDVFITRENPPEATNYQDFSYGVETGADFVVAEPEEDYEVENEILVREEPVVHEDYDKYTKEETFYKDPSDTDTFEYLIQGFSVVDGLIRCDFSGEIIADAPIAVLNLSNRANNCLHREKDNFANPSHNDVMVSDLLCISQEQLMRVRNLGVKSTEEIIENTKTYLTTTCGIDGIGEPDDTYTLAPGWSVINEIITNTATLKVVPDVIVDYLGLSVRASNSLRNGRAHRLSELIVLSQQQLYKFPNMGTKTVAEIARFVPEYLNSHQTDCISREIPESEEPSTISIVDIPELDPEVPVLASEYAAVDGRIFNRRTYRVVQDAPVEILNLSVRSLNCLKRNGYKTLASLVGLPYDEFRKIRNLGALSANEIQDKLEQYLDRKQESSAQQAVPDKTVSAAEVLNCYNEHEFEALSYETIQDMLPNAEDDHLQEALDKLIESGELIKQEETYKLYHLAFFKCIENLDSSSGLDERAIRILKMRSTGSTLEEVGQLEGTTRERIRQIEKKSIDKATRRGHMLFEEDRYAYIFTTYSFEREFYFDYLGESKQIWYYLNFRYTRGKGEPEDALDDKRISADIRRVIDKYVHKGYVLLDGKYILKQRSDLEDYVVEKYCKDEVTLDEFFALYKRFLEENEFDDEKLAVTDSVRMTRSNRLTESTRLLWKQNQRLRFYDITGGDYTELLETINLGQYSDIELSTRKFLIDYPELMKRYDLRDEYEIHNLLKKIHAEQENPNLVFGRMPSIQIGNFDRDAAVKEILFALAPVSQDDLAEMLSLEYGTRPDTIKANWLICISEYYHQGMYSVDYEDMPSDHVEILKAALTDNFYFMNEVRRIYSKLVPGADLTLLSTYNMKKMGFLIGASYVIQNYPTAEAYFKYLLADGDVVDIMPISKRFTGMTTYSAYLAGLKHEMKIIEFEPFQYINIRRLEKLGFDKDKLKQYGDRVWSFLVEDDFFTIQSLRKSGFEDELDALGFGDLFYSSLLKEDGRFSWQRVGNNVVLNPKGEQFAVRDFLVDRVTKEKSIDIDDFVFDLFDVYGITFEKHKVTEKVKGSDVYYDSIMKKLYADYATYFEEI